MKLMGNLVLLEFAGCVNSTNTKRQNAESTAGKTGLVLDPSAAAPERSPVGMFANVRPQELAAAALLLLRTATAFRIHRR